MIQLKSVDFSTGNYTDVWELFIQNINKNYVG